MKNGRKLAYQKDEIERLRTDNKELMSELKAAAIELTTKNKLIAQAETENKKLREDFERFMQIYSERIEAAEEAERRYNEALSEIKKLHKKWENEATAQIREMRHTNTTLK